MYADEALFLARIDPRHTANSLKKTEINRLYDAIHNVLLAGIKFGGASVVTYFHPDGSVGTAHQHFNVAHNRKKECAVCGGPIERLLVRGRSSSYCLNARNKAPDIYLIQCMIRQLFRTGLALGVFYGKLSVVLFILWGCSSSRRAIQWH